MKFTAKIRTVTTKHDAAGDIFTEVSFRFYQAKPDGEKIPFTTTTAMKLTGLQCTHHDKHIIVELPEVAED